MISNYLKYLLTNCHGTHVLNYLPVKTGLLLIVLNMASLTGCGNAPRGIPRGDISGEVTFQDAPVTEGVVTFFSDKTGIAAGAKLDSNGSFSIPDGIEVGSYAVTITPPYEEEPPGLTPVEKPQKKYPEIPVKYRSGETSGLQAKVENGANHYEFKMVK
tara:strand:+ start:34338 stop:34814 length:477 start_codon:yes stop_codon:yes gene_type:complete